MLVVLALQVTRSIAFGLNVRNTFEQNLFYCMEANGSHFQNMLNLRFNKPLTTFAQVIPFLENSLKY